MIFGVLIVKISKITIFDPEDGGRTFLRKFFTYQATQHYILEKRNIHS
jgi:1,2-phenylacetyl-CoA epoxidase PaaB subunit